MVVTGTFAVARKQRTTFDFRKGIDLFVTEQRLARIRSLASHVIGVADPSFLKGLAFGDLPVTGTGAGKGRRRGSVLGNQGRERLLRSRRIGVQRKTAGV